MTEEENARQYLLERRRYLALMHRRIIQKARENVNVFAEYCFNDESTGLPIIQQPFHRAWHRHADENQRALIIGPRGHGKTENFAVFRPLHLLGNDPNLRLKIVSADKETAKKRVSCIKQHIERNERVHAVFPALRCAPDEDTWSSYAIAVQRDRILKEPSVEARGITQTGEGGRCDILIGEDVCDSNNTLRVPGMRDIVKRAWHNTWENLLDPGKGRVVYIGTLWHKCIPGGTLVATDKGRVRVENLTSESRLRVSPGIFESPVAMEEACFDGELIEVRLWCQPEVYRFTPNHRLPTQRGVIEARDLTDSDSLVLDLPSRPIESLPDEPQEAIPLRVTARRLDRQRVRKTRISEEQLRGDLSSGLSYSEIAKKHGYCHGKHVLWLVDFFGLERSSMRNRVKPGWMAAPEFWRLAGYWLAEGCYDRKNGAARMVFGSSEEEVGFAEDAARCIEGVLGVAARTTRRKSSTMTAFNCRLVGEWLINEFGSGARRKRLPSWVDSLPMACLRELILGYWLGDGSSTDKVGVRFSTSSLDLAHDIARVLMGRFGAAVRIIKRGPQCSVLGGRDVRSGDAYEVRVGFGDGHSIGLPVREAVQKHGPTRLRLSNGKAFYPIRSVSGKRFIGKVYDIQTSTGYFDLAGITSHNSDLTHELMQNAEYKTLNISIGVNDEPIWPAKWPRHKLLRQKRQIGRVNYDRGYRNLAVSDEDRIFDMDRIREACERGVRMWRNRLPPEWPRYTGVDLAIGKGTTAKYSVIFTFAHDPMSQKRYVVDIKRGQWSSPRLAEQVFTAYQEHHPALIAVENNSYQAALIEWIREKYGADLPVVGIATGGEKHDLDVGIPGFSLQFDDGLWTIPQDGEMHPEDCSCSRCEWCEELEDYPAGKFTDAVMASWLADKACRFRRTNMSALGGASSTTNVRLSDAASDTVGIQESLLLPGSGSFTPDW